MGHKPNSFVRLYYIVIFLLSMFFLSYKVYKQIIFVQRQRKQLINNFYDADLENSSYEDSLNKKYKDRRLNARKIMKMKAIIKQVNIRQKIYNDHLYDSLIQPRHIVLIQVHSNVLLFQQLLASLKAAQSITWALLIFSHDVFDFEINKAVHSVNFAKYMQIFFPYSIQLHPNVYPGECRRGKDCDQSKTRDPIAAQMKHHWWWQMNQVFDYLNVTQNYNKTILLLEEDNYVTVDFLPMTTWLENALFYHCQSICEMISLGAHEPNPALYAENATISVEIWGEKMPNIGIGFSRTTWAIIKNISKDFCYFNDYTWDNSLKYVALKNMGINFYFAAIDGPRVFRIGKCEEKDFSCKPEEKVEEVTKFVASVYKTLFPWSISTELIKSENYRSVKPLGSFDDKRDQELCMYFTKNSVWY